MASRVSVNEAKTRLSEYLNRVRYGGERFVVERHGKPVGALVSLEDLAALETAKGEPEVDDKEAAFWRQMEEEGLVARRRRGPRKPLALFDLIQIEGRPISEDILADREHRDRLLSGE
jgi:prevent-host-death family protein